MHAQGAGATAPSVCLSSLLPAGQTNGFTNSANACPAACSEYPSGTLNTLPLQERATGAHLSAGQAALSQADTQPEPAEPATAARPSATVRAHRLQQRRLQGGHGVGG
jgi:hypothetical protein